MLVFVFYSLHFGGQLPFLHWHFAALAAWVVASALASGLVITEMWRLTSSATWSDKRHFRIAFVVSVVLLGIQTLSMGFALHATGARAF